jgi:predicted nucleic acid-binding protein
VYDCLYVALAMAEDADLVTCDRRLAQAAHEAGLGDRVTLIEA